LPFPSWSARKGNREGDLSKHLRGKSQCPKRKKRNERPVRRIVGLGGVGPKKLKQRHTRNLGKNTSQEKEVNSKFLTGLPSDGKKGPKRPEPERKRSKKNSGDFVSVNHARPIQKSKCGGGESSLGVVVKREKGPKRPSEKGKSGGDGGEQINGQNTGGELGKGHIVIASILCQRNLQQRQEGSDGRDRHEGLSAMGSTGKRSSWTQSEQD